MIKINKEKLVYREDSSFEFNIISKEIEVNENNIIYLCDFHYYDNKLSCTCNKVKIVFGKELSIKTYDYPHKELKKTLNNFTEYIDKYDNKYLINNDKVAYIENESFGKSIYFTCDDSINIVMTKN